MNAIRIHKRLDSETLHLPELREMIGREVEIIVIEEKPTITPGQGDFSLLEELAGKDVVDPDALEQLRKASMI